MTQTLDNKVRILLLENDPIQARLYTDNIQLKCGNGIEITSVGTLEEAKRLIDDKGSQYYSMIIVDQRVDDALAAGTSFSAYLRSDVEITPEKKAVRYKGPIIIATGSPIKDTQDALAAQNVIDVEFYQKGTPFGPLMETINKLLNRELLQRMDSATSALVNSDFVDDTIDKKVTELKALSYSVIAEYTQLKQEYEPIFMSGTLTPENKDRFRDTIKVLGTKLWPLLAKIQDIAAELKENAYANPQARTDLAVIQEGAKTAEKLIEAQYSRFEILEECTYTILQLDDEQFQREILRRSLHDKVMTYHGKKIRFNIVTVETYEEALAYLKKENVDLFLCDMNMPRVNGFEVLEMIGKGSDGKYTPNPEFKLGIGRAAVYTTLTSDADRKKVDEMGVHYLEKPMETDKLQKKIVDTIEQTP
ncbi:TPA: response regulator [Candidatus Woesearchaeota archaeon]|nr:response regulator [Candidatus Woesearchaeota archaeon]